jgi:hypothetical protein
MPDSNTDLIAFLDKVPPSDEIRRRIAENLRQKKLLQQLLRIAEQRDEVEEVSACK